MAFACQACMFPQDSVYSEIENLNRRLDQTNELLLYSHGSREKELHRRDRLAHKLKSIEASVLEGVYKHGRARSRMKKRGDKSSKGEHVNFRSFVKWRRQLWIVLDALDDATEYLSCVDTRSARRAVSELQELKVDITASLMETTDWMSSGEAKTPSRMNTAGRNRDPRSAERSLELILNEAEHVKRISHNLSADMKYELQRLKSECVAMVKDSVALNRILEEQKRELVE